MASHHRSFRHGPQPPSSGVLFTDGGPTVSGHGRHAPELGRPSGLCLSSLRPPLASTGEGPAVSGAGAHPGDSVLASAPVVPGPSGASGGDSLLPATREGSAQTATLPSLPPEPPRVSADCLAYIQRSTRHSGFSAVVARQLTLCHRRSTQLNYQAKWTVYRSWCRLNGHSMSRPTVSKVADFLLYLRRSLILPSPLTALFFLNFPLTLFSTIFFALSAWSVPFRRHVLCLGIFCWCSAFCEVLLLSRSLLPPCVTSLSRSCSWSPLLQPAGLASFRRFLAMSPSLALTFT